MFAALIGVFTESQSVFVSMLPQLEQQPLFNATNFSRNIYVAANSTVFATGLSMLGCPSDGNIGRVVRRGDLLRPARSTRRPLQQLRRLPGTWFPEAARVGRQCSTRTPRRSWPLRGT